MPAPEVVELAGEADLEGFRAACRRLVGAGVPPEAVHWRTPAREGEPDDPAIPVGANAPGAPGRAADAAAALPVRAPAFFLELCRTAILHRDPARFGLLYRLLWRLQHEPALRHDALDPDRVAAEHLAQAVRRGLHDMKAGVRLRSVADATELVPALTQPMADGDAVPGPLTADLAAGAPLAGPWHVAWFEPEHNIVEAVATFLVRRHPRVRWALLSPRRSARWDGCTLAFAPGARPADRPPADAGERAWLAWCKSVFDPARLEFAPMPRGLPAGDARPVRAPLTAPLAASPEAPTRAMATRDGSDPNRHRTAAAGAPEPNRPDPTAEDPVTLADLAQAIERCRECPLGALATQAVPGEGPRRGARLMFVGEQPGDQEDLRGRPFVGPAGQLLDRAFKELGWPRDKVYVTNAVKHFKFELRGKRRIHKTPAQQEAAACLHWLESEIDLVRPEALVALGATAARQLMGTTVPVLRERGHWLKRRDGLRVLITLHPSALLRTDPEDRDAAYATWLADLRGADGYFRDA